jgi:hypothetical protein
MIKENIIIIFTCILLVSISIYNYLTYLELDQAKRKYKNTKKIGIGMWSNLLTMILSIFLLIIISILVFKNKV